MPSDLEEYVDVPPPSESGESSSAMEFVPAQPVASYTQSSESTPFTPETTYAYLIGTRNLSRNQALGIMANIRRESSFRTCLLYTSPSPRDRTRSRMPSSA